MSFCINKNSLIIGSVLMLAAFVHSCKYDVKELEPSPDAAFTVTPVVGETNKFLLTSSAQNAFRFDWDKADTKGFVTGKQVDTAYFPDKGTYVIKSIVYGQGGFDTASQTITVANDDPAAQTPLKLLTNNGTRTWKLAPEAGALWIGPSDNSATWWQNTSGDITARSCQFNDELTFSITGNTLVIDNKGDFYVDMEGSTVWPSDMPGPAGCYANSAIPSKYQPWTDGNFTFEVIDNNKLKLNGTGAHLGVYKAGNPPNAAVTAPESSITYDIVSITNNRLVVRLDYGWGAWRFTYVPVQ